MALVDLLRPDPRTSTKNEALAKENQVLAEGATGIEHHPEPVFNPPPLVTKDQHRAEFPYTPR